MEYKARLGDLENTCFEFFSQKDRLGFFLELAQRLNCEFLERDEADEILKAILVGVTAGEGLGFNRAFWFRFDEDKRCLKGSLALGPGDAKEANAIWEGLKNESIPLFEMLDKVSNHFKDVHHPLNRIIHGVEIPIDKGDHFLVRALRQKEASILHTIPAGEIWPLGGTPIALAPVATGPNLYGVIVADNQILHHPIRSQELESLVLFSTIASMAITKAKICALLKKKIQELDALNKDLFESREWLVKAEKTAEMSRIADRVFHEIRNPLCVVGGLAKVLARRSEEKEISEIASRILQGTERIEESVKDLFRFNEGPELSLEPLEIRSLLQSLFRVISVDLERHGIDGRLTMNIGNVVLYLDLAHFRQCIFHVVHNAIDSMPKGGFLLLTVRPSGPYVVIESSYSGMKGNGENCCAFSRNSEPKAIFGLGLGLNLAKQIVELHGGSFEVSSNRFGGKTVTIALPIKNSAS